MLVTYKQARQPVMVNAMEESRNGRMRKGQKNQTVPALINAMLPDIDTTVDGQKTKLVFKYVDAQTVEIMAISLESGKMEDGKVVPVIHNMKMDFKEMKVYVNGEKAFDLIGKKTEEVTGKVPEVYSRIDSGKIVKGIVLPVALKGVRFLTELASIVLLYVSTVFVINNLSSLSSIVIQKSFSSSFFSMLMGKVVDTGVKAGLSSQAAFGFAQKQLVGLAGVFGSTPQSLLNAGVTYSTFVPVKSLEAMTGVHVS